MKKLIFIFVAFLAVSCSSGKKALEQGNYYEAVVKAADRLRSNGSHSKSLSVLRQAYPLAVSGFKEDIGNLEASTEAFKFAKTVSIYNKLQKMYTEIRSSPAAKRAVSPKSFFKQRDKAKLKAAEEYYMAGDQAMLQNDRESAKKAYNYFERTGVYSPDFRDSRERMKEAFEKASIKVVVAPLQAPGEDYRDLCRKFESDLNAYLNSGRLNKFVNVYTEYRASQEGIVADHYLRYSFANFTVGQVFLKANRETVTKDSVQIGKKTVDGKSVPVFGDAEAKFTSYHKKITTEGILNVSIMDYRTQENLYSEQITKEYLWQDRWGTFRGDEEALSKSQKTLAGRKEREEPKKIIFFEKVWDKIHSDLINKLNAFYRKY